MSEILTLLKDWLAKRRYILVACGKFMVRGGPEREGSMEIFVLFVAGVWGSVTLLAFCLPKARR